MGNGRGFTFREKLELGIRRKFPKVAKLFFGQTLALPEGEFLEVEEQFATNIAVVESRESQESSLERMGNIMVGTFGEEYRIVRNRKGLEFVREVEKVIPLQDFRIDRNDGTSTRIRPISVSRCEGQDEFKLNPGEDDELILFAPEGVIDLYRLFKERRWGLTHEMDHILNNILSEESIAAAKEEALLVNNNVPLPFVVLATDFAEYGDYKKSLARRGVILNCRDQFRMEIAASKLDIAQRMIKSIGNIAKYNMNAQGAEDRSV